MDWFISHESALEYWRLARSGQIDHRGVPRSKALAAKGLKIKSLDSFGSFNLTPPLHILVPEGNARRISRKVSCHVWGTALPRGCFIGIEKGLLVSSPEFSYLQMAGKLPFLKLIELGFELCGTYTMSPDSRAKFQLRDSLTSVAKLRAFLEKMPGARGCAKARKALEYVADNSASPMETLLTMLLSLPHRLGGYGFAIPLLNHRIDISTTAKKAADKRYYVCDLYWPASKVAVEYDSSAFHTGATRIANDSLRRNALAYLDITVVSITSRQVYHIAELEKTAYALAKHLNIRIRVRASNFPKKQRELRMLLPIRDDLTWS
jgi:hypothetical protein